MGSSWMFGCKKGLSQGTCNEYKTDEESRGYSAARGGCPSCDHREPFNAATTNAEAYHAKAD